MNRIGRPFGALLVLVLAAAMAAGCSARSSGASGVTGKTGSRSRFAVKDDHLFVLSGVWLRGFALKAGDRPEPSSSTAAPLGAETIFALGDRLYLGTVNGLEIFDATNPREVRHLGRHGHVSACDPVVVRDHVAFVTLRSGTTCRAGESELQVLDVARPTEPKLLARYAMLNPSGLGVDGDLLFVVDGMAGIKIYDVRDPRVLRLLYTIPVLRGYDVIVGNGRLIVSAEDGIHQYGYQAQAVASTLTRLGKLPIE